MLGLFKFSGNKMNIIKYFFLKIKVMVNIYFMFKQLQSTASIYRIVNREYVGLY